MAALAAAAATLLLAVSPAGLAADATSPRPPSADAWQEFTLETWKQWRSEAAEAVVVFTSTDCAYCPGVIADLKRRLDALPGPRRPLRIVVTDGARLTPELAREPHYAAADLRAAWRGAELPLYHAVNPRWHGETPYVVRLGAAGARFFLGAPPDFNDGNSAPRTR